eukprot:7388056-Prymnesium_polylepis.1
MRFANRRVIEANKDVRLTFSDSSTQDVTLIQKVDGVEDFGQLYTLSAVQTSSVRIDVLSAWTTANNGARELAFYFDCDPNPVPTSGPIASLTGDPHAHGAHGDSFDIKGEHKGIYVVLSTASLSLALQMVHDTFLSPYSKVWIHGSWVRHAYWVIRTRHGVVLRVAFHADKPRSFVVNGNTTIKPFALDDVSMTLKGRKFTIVNAEWRTWVESTISHPHPNKLRMNTWVQPLYDTRRGCAAPHGLLGQTYDNDNVPRHGCRDRTDTLDDGRATRSRSGIGGHITTRASGEGAIEGSAHMYRIKTPFSTAFAFSRFGKYTALPRNVTVLSRTGHPCSSSSSGT